jgi:hypothetical protein
MISNSVRYRRAAAACRKTAKSSSTPAEWLGFAADWDRMAEQAESLAAQEVAFDDAVLRDSTMHAASIGQTLIMHLPIDVLAGRMTHKASFWYRLVSRD